MLLERNKNIGNGTRCYWREIKVVEMEHDVIEFTTIDKRRKTAEVK